MFAKRRASDSEISRLLLGSTSGTNLPWPVDDEEVPRLGERQGESWSFLFKDSFTKLDVDGHILRDLPQPDSFHRLFTEIHIKYY